MPTILAVDDNGQQIAARLLAAAGDRADLVQVVTGGTYLGFSVPDDIARAAGYLDDDADADPAPDSVPEPEDDSAQSGPEQELAAPKKAPAKHTPRTSSRAK
ncbi:hypothetical protein GFY24_00750 [Nocardia sp. SYP-A9097]|uniref:hypothetical protein n=1 Tax=Nocardia sp. SYP-A9097 TaxID=2663237 RepID=UPI00129A4006|nr:hypothetical protein [Nocardia sp. SYP-A9097]MRH86006.1 hypothetical protein [Nocardia sp. SYP-A9097]